MNRALSHDDPLEGLPSRARIAELILGGHPPRDTSVGWQHYRSHYGLLVPAPVISLKQMPMIPASRKADYDLYRHLTNANLPLQDTPMHDKVGKLIRRRLRGNTMKQDDPTRAGVMVSGWGNYGKTASVCSAGAVFEDQWLQLHSYLNPGALPGTRDLHAPVVYVSTPVTATPKSLCVSILGFFRAAIRKSITLPELVRQVADSLHDHGVKALILDDISRLRMHRADDQDVLDLMRAFMNLDVTLILTGVNIPGIGLLREAKWNKKTRQWEMPPLESTRIHGLEITQTEHRFELIELDRFRYTTPKQIHAFVDHLEGIEQHLRLLNAKEGMLTGSTMPEYLMRRTGGVVGLLGRLIEDGAQEAMESGKELIDETLLDEIVLQRDKLEQPPDEPVIPADPPTTSENPKAKRPRNTVFDDQGPAARSGA
ncbi:MULTISPECIES: TniB family NTP-binding protein [unclassified Streptomyces]|uniref:TniB family NTP-binding protein n=1 Tax=unclassified Streptomyces TaxID=2593676 RepID=UPI0029B921E9|nr:MULTISPECIES: TniB family NTP-binding protein [unclassified Streptomyces]MDX3771173.1 TniB family NTP-binding protein [Streptomyces sp. AK08-01B]MDX3820786.1 TniB family NTP-binding protein [Streptomyces sp. AK08-01A]